MNQVQVKLLWMLGLLVVLGCDVLLIASGWLSAGDVFLLDVSLLMVVVLFCGEMMLDGVLHGRRTS